MREVSATIFHCPCVCVSRPQRPQKKLVSRVPSPIFTSPTTAITMKQLCLILLTSSLATAEIQFHHQQLSDLQDQSVDEEPAPNLPEVDVKIIPTHIDIAKLREAYATENHGERFLPGPSRLPLELFHEQRRRRK
ncbi:hypothetical protein Y032_0019g3835 [Ancylostoma ceylanicum]|nr:hypothetical protein Y032_0019g3835 [Ancylostoma ceylanicum]